MFAKSCGIDIRRSTLRTCGLLLWLLPMLTCSAATDPEGRAWLLIDTDQLTLSVMHGERPAMTLYNIAIGRYGASRDKHRGDNNTPLGRFRVSGIRHKSDFHRFIALDYPDVERAHRAAGEGVINQHQLQTILAAHRRGGAPPQNTALGGQIGIHGLGRADPGLHQSVNWTRGCVALTDEQVDSLLAWVHTGMTVEIR